MGGAGAEEIFWPKLTCAEGAREIFGLAEDLEKNLPNHLGGGGGSEGGGWVVSDPPQPPPGHAELSSKTLPHPPPPHSGVEQPSSKRLV